LIELEDDFVDKIVQLAPATAREAQIVVGDGHKKRYFLYDDDAAKYVEVVGVERAVLQTGDVSNVESFLALVREETVRRATDVADDGSLSPATDRKKGATSLATKRHDGSFMTVVFGAKGATFSPDDRIRLDAFTYTRVHSPQWSALIASLNKPYEHKEFIRALQRLRPSIVNYEELMRQLRKISFSDKTNIASEPLLQNGQSQNEYRVDIEVRGGVTAGNTSTSTALPSSFDVSLQYARGGEHRYTTTVEIDLSTLMKAERKELRFTLIAPDLPNVEESAIDDEVAFFRSKVEDIPRLLVLQDY
jgi:hypothetical protein